MQQKKYHKVILTSHVTNWKWAITAAPSQDTILECLALRSRNYGGESLSVKDIMQNICEAIPNTRSSLVVANLCEILNLAGERTFPGI